MIFLVQVIPILPGGMTILGLFFVGNGDVFSNSTSLAILKKLLSSINKFIEDNEFYFIDRNLNHKIVLFGSDEVRFVCSNLDPFSTNNY